MHSKNPENFENELKAHLLLNLNKHFSEVDTMVQANFLLFV